jgi:hypothetical protein
MYGSDLRMLTVVNLMETRHCCEPSSRATMRDAPWHRPRRRALKMGGRFPFAFVKGPWQPSEIQPGDGHLRDPQPANGVRIDGDVSGYSLSIRGALWLPCPRS